jgi:hypothetical protein
VNPSDQKPKKEIVNDFDSRYHREAQEQSKRSTAVANEVESTELLLKNEGIKARAFEEDFDFTLVWIEFESEVASAKKKLESNYVLKKQILSTCRISLAAARFCTRSHHTSANIHIDPDLSIPLRLSCSISCRSPHKLSLKLL